MPRSEKEQLSRRELLKHMGVFGAVLVAMIGRLTVDEGLKFANISAELEADWEEAHKYRTPEEFIAAHKEWLQHIEFGYNFSPDYLIHVFSARNPNYPFKEKMPSPQAVVDFIKERLHMNCGRMALRMNQIMDVDENLDLGFYERWLKVFAKAGLGLVVASGLKAPRWPEWHILQAWLDRVFGNAIPDDFGHEVKIDDPVGHLGLRYHHNLTKLLRKYYDLVGYQPENEPRAFAPDAFTCNWRLSDEYMRGVLQVIAATLDPKTQIWVNALTLFDMPHQAFNLVQQAIRDDPSLAKRIRLAINYYSRFPTSYLDIGDNEVFDTIAENDMTGTSMSEVWLMQILAKILGAVTEMQVEGWGNSAKSQEPGYDLQLMFFALLRLQRVYAFDTSAAFQPNFQIFPWGIEELMRHMMEPSDPHRPEHLQIIDFVQRVNDLSGGKILVAA